MLPFHYAIRNLFRSKGRLLQTVGGSALVVLLVMAAVAINRGMSGVLSASVSDRNGILLGAGSEESVQRSEIAEVVAGIASASVPGVTETLGVRAVSGEIHFMNYLSIPGREPEQVTIRGVSLEALHVYPKVRILDGSFPESGEILVGRLAGQKLGLGKHFLSVGKRVILGGQEFTISGVFAAPGTVMEAEIWARLGDVRVLSQRDSLSCAVLRFDDAEDFSELDLFAKQRLDLELSAVRESDYYRRLSDFFGPLRLIVMVTAGLIATSALFGGINTLYAAFSSRVKEVATLQAIGFKRSSILISLLQESMLSCLLGTLLALVLAIFLLDAQTLPFSIGVFTVEVGPRVAISGIVTGVLLGLLGTLPPAIRCLKPPLPVALRMS